MKVKPELYDIAGSVINRGITNAVTPLPDEDLTTLHYVVTKVIHDRKHLTDTLKQHIYQYVESLTRYHRALFWKIFNYFCKQTSEVWYLCNRQHINIILYSLACIAPKVSLEYWAQVQSLENACYYPVENGALGMSYSH